MSSALLVVAMGAALVVFGVLWRGSVRRPISPRRAREAQERLFAQRLRRAADMAIAAARRQAAPDEPAIIRVEDVIRVMSAQFGHHPVPRDQAAAALRERFEAGACRTDCLTDAFD
ncbi:hypothetical protein H9Y04_34015 [Streptomyces sp. TRM66268-LWL]|uniref:Uncharacterized protein n=1 Tax=Streptomyces polyasparticus TaxID=2767826 RepID=A0ABR7SQB7_9ACTN|nr:hypothetical protein [Streptomyces polyasparticus]MBC9717559.1 hypothetical protein [Streptomyces polyasparticus]